MSMAASLADVQRRSGIANLLSCCCLSSSTCSSRVRDSLPILNHLEIHLLPFPHLHILTWLTPTFPLAFILGVICSGRLLRLLETVLENLMTQLYAEMIVLSVWLALCALAEDARLICDKCVGGCRSRSSVHWPIMLPGSEMPFSFVLMEILSILRAVQKPPPLESSPLCVSAAPSWSFHSNHHAISWYLSGGVSPPKVSRFLEYFSSLYAECLAQQ